MQDEPQAGSVRNELLERLRSLDSPPSAGALAEIAYKRSKEALEHALEEARAIRLQAIEDARHTRERELNALRQSLESLRMSAEAQVDSMLRIAEIEAGRLREQAEAEAQRVVEQARTDSQTIKAEAVAMRASAEDRARELERLEAEFNRVMADIADRVGIRERPSTGWLNRLGRSSR
jgi:dsDNA-specific endonuclease/ATPase MutS2